MEIIFIVHGSQTLEQTIWLWNHTSHTKVTAMNLLQMHFVITWAWSFLTSEVLEAVRGQKHHLGAHFGTLTQRSVHLTAPVLLTKDSRNEISYDFQPPFSLHISNSRTKPTGLDFYFHKIYQHVAISFVNSFYIQLLFVVFRMSGACRVLSIIGHSIAGSHVKPVVCTLVFELVWALSALGPPGFIVSISR